MQKFLEQCIHNALHHVVHSAAHWAIDNVVKPISEVVDEELKERKRQRDERKFPFLASLRERSRKDMEFQEMLQRVRERRYAAYAAGKEIGNTERED